MDPDTGRSREFSDAERAVAGVVGLSLVGFLVLLVMVHQSFEALSGARAYVAGEGLWSKAQKDAVYHLLRASLLDEKEGYGRFREELEVTLGDRQARLELERPNPDMDRVREGLLQGRNHPDDVDRMATFFRRYRNLGFVDRAIGIWEQGDEAIDELLDVGARIEAAHEAGAGPTELLPLLEELDWLNTHLTDLEERFSRELGAGSRWAQRTLFALILLAALVLAAITVGMAWFLSRRLSAAERSLRSSEARYRNLFESSPFGIYRSSMDGRLLEANPALKRMLGYGEEEDVTDLDMAERLYGDPEVRRRLVEWSRGAGEVIRHVEVEWRRKDRSRLMVSLSGRILRDEGGEPTGFEMFVEDVTERRALETQLRQAQKMEAFGQLTGGIAHDFNNLLTVILSSASFLEEELQEGDASADSLDLHEIGNAARRGAEMIRKLLAFSRQSPLQVKKVDLPGLVQESETMIRRMLPPTVDLRLRWDPQCPPVRADPGAVQQMLLNLAANARDAMPGGGVLDMAVEVWTEGLGSSSVEDGRAAAKDLVALRVQDTGEGMSPEVMERIFEPFFTTKPVDRGTGLGLPMVYGLARQLGGNVEVESELGEGTEVRVLFRQWERGNA